MENDTLLIRHVSNIHQGVILDQFYACRAGKGGDALLALLQAQAAAIHHCHVQGGEQVRQEHSP